MVKYLEMPEYDSVYTIIFSAKKWHRDFLSHIAIFFVSDLVHMRLMV